ncbi:MAG: SseB family protein [Anaerolineae bacterium]|nr:SseB family protein [Anaerolineae bacterium]
MLYDALLESTLLIPTQSLPPETEGEVELPAQSSLGVLMAQLPDGRAALISFTDEAALIQWRREGHPYIALPTRHFFPMAVENQIAVLIINPAGPVSGQLTDQEMRALAQGLHPGTPDAVEAHHLVAQQEVQVAAAEPGDMPSANTLGHLRHILQWHPNVQAVYVFWVRVGEGDPELAAGLLFGPMPDPSALDQQMRQIVAAISPALDHDRELHFVALHGGWLPSVQAVGTLVYHPTGDPPQG